MRRPLRFTLIVAACAVLAAACATTTSDDARAIAAAAGDDPTVAALPAPVTTPVDVDDQDAAADDAAGTIARSGTPPAVESFTCPFNDDALTPVDCGRVTMPGRGADPNYSVSLVFARFYATGPAEELRGDPVVYLHGGPGGAIVESAEFWYDSIIAPHIAQRDVILYDQRGGGRSTSLPVCHEANEIGDRFYTDVAPHEQLAGEYLARLADCADKFVDLTSVDITAFNSAINAQDLVDLLWALDIETYNLHGSSYGSRLAQTIMRDAPEGVRSVVLSGAYPVAANLMGSIPQSIETSLDAVFAGCAANEACAGALPDPWQTLQDLVEELDANPLPVAVPTTADGSFDIRFDGTDLLNGLHDLLYVGTNAATVPDLLIDHLDGDDRRLARLARNAVFDHSNVATFLLVQCADESAFTEPADLDRPLRHEFLRAVDLAPAINGIDALEICAEWDTGVANPVENDPVVWDAPTLIFAGAVDPITPPQWAADLAALLPRSRLVNRADASHDADEGFCALGILENFIRDPDLIVDTTCTARVDNLRVDELAGRFLAPTGLIDLELTVGDTAIAVDVPDWIGDWSDELHIRWRALDAYDRTALLILEADHDYPLVDHLPFYGTIPDWASTPGPTPPQGWERRVMATTGGDLISYRSSSIGIELVLVVEPDETADLERTLLLPAATSVEPR